MEKQNGAASVALARIEPTAVNPYEPRSYEQAGLMAQDFASSKLTKCRTKEQTLLIMATGHELGIPATTALRMIYVADFGQGDQVTLSADLMVALCLRSPLCEYFETVESTNERAVVRAKRKGRPERVQPFTIEDKERAKLGKVNTGKDESATNWAKYPAVMLRHRAASILAREVFPDVIGGFYTADEMAEAATNSPPATVRPLSSATASNAPIVDGEIVERPAPQPAKEPEFDNAASLEFYKGKLNAARSQSEGDSLAKEIVKTWPEKSCAERLALRDLLGARKAAGWAQVSTTEEPTPQAGLFDRDPASGEG